MFRQAATIVVKVLRGAKPSDLPVEQPTKLELAINLKPRRHSASLSRPRYWPPPNCSWRSSERWTCVQALTPLLSPLALSARIFEFTTDLASSRYQPRHALAYISAASSSVTNMQSPIRNNKRNEATLWGVTVR